MVVFRGKNEQLAGSPVAKSENNTKTFEPDTGAAFLIKSVVCLC